MPLRNLGVLSSLTNKIYPQVCTSKYTGMKNLVFALLICMAGKLSAQQVVTVVEPQDLALKGETKAMFGGKAKTVVDIELPMGTQKWYYAFSAREEGDTKVSIDLKGQVEALIASGQLSTDKIQLPKGSLDMNFYMLDQKAKSRFLETQTDFGLSDYGYYDDYSIERRTVGVVEVDLPSDHTWYIGIKNPNSMENGIVHVEVVAVIGGAEVGSATEENSAQKKAELYGNLGFKKIQEGDYATALEYFDKSAAEKRLGWVEANRGLAQLLAGNGNEAIDTYVNAITLIKEQPESEHVLKEQLRKVEEFTKGKNLSGAEEVKEIIRIEL